MKHLKYIIFILFSYSWNVAAQIPVQIIPPNSVNVILVPISGSISLFDTTFNINNQMMLAKVLINVQDSLDIDKIHIKFGTTLNGNDLANYSFNNDPNQTLPANYSYKYFNQNYTLAIGQYTGLTAYYCEVLLEYSGGQLAVPIVYVLE